jgi:superoxide dismutase
VLKALDGYHLPLEAQSSSSGPKKEASSLSVANKRACVILMESLADVMKDRDKVSEELKKSARRIADSWKSKINWEAQLTSSNRAIEAQSFLQLLATFGLASEYDPDELCKLVIPITRRRQTPSLCRVLGLSSKVPGLSVVGESKF